MMTKKGKILVVVIIIVVILVLIGGALAYLYIKTDKLKSSKTLFQKYLGKSESFAEGVQTIDFVSQKNDSYKSNTSAKVTYTTGIGTTSEDTSNNINQLGIVIDGKVDKNNNYNYKKIQLQNGENTEASIESVQNGDQYGINFNDLFEQYIVDNNTNLKDLLKKIGVSEEVTSNIPNSINVEDINWDDIKFSNDELTQLEQKYLKIVTDSVGSNEYSKQSNASVEINGKKYFANAYSVSLTREQLNNLYIKLLESLKDDEIVLSKLDKMQEMIEKYFLTSIGTTNINVKDYYTNKISNTIQNIQSNNIGNDECKIIVYENQKQTIKIAIQTNNYEYGISYTELDEEKYFNIEKIVNEKTNKKLEIDSTDSKKTITIENDEDRDNIKKLSLEKDITTQDKNENNKYSLKYEDGTQRATLNIEQKIESGDIGDKVNLSSDKSINVSSLNVADSNALVELVKSRTDEKLEQIKQNIKIDDITKMLQNLKVLKDSTQISSQGNLSETEKNRYNSRFEMFQGENLESSSITSMINTLKDCISNIELISNTDMKIDIEDGKGNEQIVNTLLNFFDKNKSNKYNVKLEYNDKGLVNAIDLVIVPRS